MDFRLVNPESITWKRGHGANVVAVLPEGTKVVVQTPKCACGVSLHSPGTFRVSMKFKQLDPVHREFEEWLRRVENNASGPWKTQRDLKSAVYSSTFSIMAFSDTMAFDESGKLSADLPNAKSCSALVELSGAWTGDGVWGPRWKIVQLKFWTTGEADECLFVDDD